MEEHGFVHKSVLLYETVGSLNIKPGGIYVDGTLGGGGHAYEVCKRLGSGRLIGIDQDADAIQAAGRRLAPFKDKVTIVRSNYRSMAAVLKELEIPKVDGIYLVGGTCCLTGIEGIIEKKTGIPTYKPGNPMFVTPLGIARNCTAQA